MKVGALRSYGRRKVETSQVMALSNMPMTPPCECREGRLGRLALAEFGNAALAPHVAEIITQIVDVVELGDVGPE